MRAVQRNLLYNLCAIGAVAVGVFLLLGAWGHFEAVLPLLRGDAAGAGQSAFALLLPSVLLAVGGVLNGVLCKVLWDGRRSAVDFALVLNLLLLGYLAWLLWVGVPGHPVATFAGVVAGNIVLLAATRLGLVWPATAAG